jgi:hypothetical protein
MDILLSNTRKISSFVRHIVGLAGGVFIGLTIGDQSDVDGVMTAVDAVFSNIEGLLGAAMGALAVGAGIYAKIKAFFAE